ncbi:hypothetical protein [Nonomuraea sp. NPDC050643]|uniref:hypothetical protein n=1 Tax=Nonomuraea sp. NPDC050643 TaxID=3155660 RepID=UPI0033E164DB
MLHATLTALAVALSGCGTGSSDEAQCIEVAVKEAVELKKETTKLLPPKVAETVSENHGCDSGGEGSYLIFETDRSITGYKLLEPFRRHNWEALDAPTDSCSQCTAGVSKETGGRIIDVWVYDRSDLPTMEVVVQYR